MIKVNSKKVASGTNLTTICTKKPKKVAAVKARKAPTKTGGPNKMTKSKSPIKTRKLHNSARTVKG